MNVTVAKSAGFCFGVKRAVELVYDEAGLSGPVYTFGPIIHNDEVVKDLEEKGVTVIHSPEDLKLITEGCMIVRSHGVAKSIYEQIEAQGLKLVDATCPFVRKIHKAVEEQEKKGRLVIIIGNDKHPEVEGIKGWCSAETIVIETEEDAKNLSLPLDTSVSIVSQTTFNNKKFQDLVEIISEKGYDIFVLNTICNATEERQTEAYELAKASDAMIVIGGKHSSNTQKLYEICKKECEDTYYIQTLTDLDLNNIKSYCSVGITAGASTPNNIIKEVQRACQN